MSGSGISWAICKLAPCSRQTTTPAPHHSVFYRPDAVPAAQPTVSKHWRKKTEYSRLQVIATSLTAMGTHTPQCCLPPDRGCISPCTAAELVLGLARLSLPRWLVTYGKLFALTPTRRWSPIPVLTLAWRRVTLLIHRMTLLLFYAAI